MSAEYDAALEIRAGMEQIEQSLDDLITPALNRLVDRLDAIVVILSEVVRRNMRDPDGLAGQRQLTIAHQFIVEKQLLDEFTERLKAAGIDVIG